VLEDLDSLINGQNRSFFLNQVDGLEGNDGLLIVGTTNHFDMLDPALSGRPSRFDRKFLFDDPDLGERAQYAKYWQEKLHSNKSVAFPEHLVTDIAGMTDRFSFAYLKEAFVSSLVLLAGFEGEKPSFESVMKSQIKTLRDQIDKGPQHAVPRANNLTPTFSAVPRADGRAHRLEDWLLGQQRVWDAGEGPHMSMPGALPGLARPRTELRDARAMGRLSIV